MLEYSFPCSSEHLERISDFANELELKPCDYPLPVKTWIGYPFSDSGTLRIDYNPERTDSSLRVNVWHREAMESPEVIDIIDRIKLICETLIYPASNENNKVMEAKNSL